MEEIWRQYFLRKNYLRIIRISVSPIFRSGVRFRVDLSMEKKVRTPDPGDEGILFFKKKHLPIA